MSSPYSTSLSESSSSWRQQGQQGEREARQQRDRRARPLSGNVSSCVSLSDDVRSVQMAPLNLQGTVRSPGASTLATLQVQSEIKVDHARQRTPIEKQEAIMNTTSNATPTYQDPSNKEPIMLASLEMSPEVSAAVTWISEVAEAAAFKLTTNLHNHTTGTERTPQPRVCKEAPSATGSID